MNGLVGASYPSRDLLRDSENWWIFCSSSINVLFQLESASSGVRADERFFLGGGGDKEEDYSGYYDYSFDPYFEYRDHGDAGPGHHFMSRDAADLGDYYEDSSLASQLASFSLVDFLQGILNLNLNWWTLNVRDSSFWTCWYLILSIDLDCNIVPSMLLDTYLYKWSIYC